jgi:hypothetical protein
MNTAAKLGGCVRYRWLADKATGSTCALKERQGRIRQTNEPRTVASIWTYPVVHFRRVDTLEVSVVFAVDLAIQHLVLDV